MVTSWLTRHELPRDGQEATVKVWDRLISRLMPRPASCQDCNLYLEFSGAPPGNSSEDLIRQVVKGRRSVSLHWLELELAGALYKAALRRYGWMVDIGIPGPNAFRKEVADTISGMRPEFGVLVEQETKIEPLPPEPSRG